MFQSTFRTTRKPSRASPRLPNCSLVRLYPQTWKFAIQSQPSKLIYNLLIIWFLLCSHRLNSSQLTQLLLTVNSIAHLPKCCNNLNNRWDILQHNMPNLCFLSQLHKSRFPILQLSLSHNKLSINSLNSPRCPSCNRSQPSSCLIHYDQTHHHHPNLRA
jgi:hypothetical protein